MKLDSFRELLVKKSQSASQRNLIKFIKDEVLADFIMESLEKMARGNHKGDSANFAIRDFATEMDPSHEPAMIHDALSHHASNYKAALNSGNQSVANQHAKQIFRIMDMADQAQKHTHGKLQLDTVAPQPWERHTKTNTYAAGDPKVSDGSYKPGDFKTKTKGWRHRGSDYSFLQQAPHPSPSSLQEVRRHGHDNAYPLEETKVNGKYLDIEDVQAPTAYKPHPFDSHPVMQHFEEPAGSRTPERDKQYLAERDNFAKSPALDQYFSAQESREKANPEAYSQRGNRRALPVHKQVDALNVPKESAPQQAITRKPARAAAAPVSRPVLTPEERAQAIALLSPELRRKLGLDDENQ